MLPIPLHPSRGAVVAHLGRLWVWWDSQDGAPYGLPILQSSNLRRRHDVPVVAIEDLAALGAGGRDVIVRAGRPETIHARAVPIGRVPDALLGEIVAAWQAELVARCVEDRWTGHSRHERAVRM